MRRHYLTGVAAVALALGVTAVGAQTVDQRRDTDQGRKTDQVESNQQPQTSGQSQNPPSQQRSDQRQDTQSQQGAQQQNAPATSGQSRQGTQESKSPQNQQHGAQAPQQTQPRKAEREPQGGEKQQGVEAEQPDKSGLIALDDREQTRISDIIRQQRIQPVTKLNFSLNVASTVPPSVRLSRISGELADIFPNYRDFSFFIAKQELVIVDSESYAIVALVPYSAGSTVGRAPPRENTGSVSTEEPPSPAKKKAVRTEKENTAAVGTQEPPAPANSKAVRTEKEKTRVTGAEQKPGVTERETLRRRPARTQTEVTVGTSRRDSDEFDEPPPRDRGIRPPPRDRGIEPPVRERVEHDEGPPFPFSLFFGRPN
jgi:hypothetical protein